MMLPTARAARGLPASRATAPYEITRPGGMRRKTDRTLRVNSVSGRRAGVTSVLCRSLRESDPAQRRTRLDQSGAVGRVVAGGAEVSRGLLHDGLDGRRAGDALLH